MGVWNNVQFNPLMLPLMLVLAPLTLLAALWFLISLFQALNAALALLAPDEPHTHCDGLDRLLSLTLIPSNAMLWGAIWPQVRSLMLPVLAVSAVSSVCVAITQPEVSLSYFDWRDLVIWTGFPESALTFALHALLASTLLLLVAVCLGRGIRGTMARNVTASVFILFQLSMSWVYFQMMVDDSVVSYELGIGGVVQIGLLVMTIIVLWLQFANWLGARFSITMLCMPGLFVMLAVALISIELGSANGLPDAVLLALPDTLWSAGTLCIINILAQPAYAGTPATLGDAIPWLMLLAMQLALLAAFWYLACEALRFWRRGEEQSGLSSRRAAARV